ncbi:Peptidase inhibitor I78 family protein [Hartmannibacter diazotrophicus]|uniref:Peptidase inhibitor I78 family protein n=1 Tax=Hartmannibacter diazotrophicus TaxID=1482074 RepID=A0A2C9D8E8_9HYPH|nr:I78 family peptidase inhibitor [Hartmannibacter diazotrophicus]SON56546.1 Peptidase inhibitor I78 family protein [Hartmannibacter diazotrophicus]
MTWKVGKSAGLVLLVGAMAGLQGCVSTPPQNYYPVYNSTVPPASVPEIGSPEAEAMARSRSVYRSPAMIYPDQGNYPYGQPGEISPEEAARREALYRQEQERLARQPREQQTPGNDVYGQPGSSTVYDSVPGVGASGSGQQVLRPGRFTPPPGSTAGDNGGSQTAATDPATPAPSAPAAPSRGAGSCNASAASGIVGKTNSQSVIVNAQKVTGARAVRIVAPGEINPNQYNPNRLNIIVGSDGKITGVQCG